MSEALKSFKLIKSKLLQHLDFDDDDYFDIEEAIKEIEHTLMFEVLERKALETLKDKNVNKTTKSQLVYLEEKENEENKYRLYDSFHFEYRPLTKKEFELLKAL